MRKYLIPMAALLMLAACGKNEEDVVVAQNDEQVSSPDVVYIQAQGGESDVKSEIDGNSGAFTWSTGDQIAVYTTDGYKKSNALAEGGEAKVDFAFASGFVDANRADVAVFPASLVFDGTAVRTGSAAKHTVGAGGELTITLPGSYALAEVQGDKIPTPMVAVNEPGKGLAFKSICPLVRVTVKNIAKDAQSIKITFPGKKVQGEFTLSDLNLGTSNTDGVLLSDSSESGDDTITITDLGFSSFQEQMVVNVPVPIGISGSQEYDNVVVTACDASGLRINYIVSPLKVVGDAPTAWAPGRKAAKKVTASLPVFTVSGASIAAADRKMIVFAPGNLRAKLDVVPQAGSLKYEKDKETGEDKVTGMNCAIKCFGTADEWRFADHQYDAISDYIPAGRTHAVNTYEEAKKGDYVDLFAWVGSDMTNTTLIGKGAEYKYGIFYGANSGTSGYLGNTTGATLAYDWGTLQIKYGEGTYAANSWRTPTANEWEFVLSSRKLASTPRIEQGAKARITQNGNKNEVIAYGLIILPDNYSHPYGVAALNKVYCQANKSYTAPSGAVSGDNVYELDDWAKLEDAGCVFLPLTNMQTFNADAQQSLTRSPGVGLYWSSTNSKTSLCVALAFNCVDSGLATNSYPGGDPATDNLQFKYSRSRYYSCAVRLIRDVN